MKRRDFLKTTGFLLTFPAVFSRSLKADNINNRVMVLGIDGMDPNITMSLAKQGKLPNIRKFLNSEGHLRRMMSSVPPFSPVAWASFSTGRDPGAHGVFDFFGRNPETYIPKDYFTNSTSPGKFIDIGGYKIPMDSAEISLIRKTKPFWDYLQDRKIESSVIKMPTNYPPSKMKFGRAISGLGTPDLYGTYGQYTLYTTDENEARKDLSPNKIYYAYFDELNTLEGEVEGPVNSLKKEPEQTLANFKVYWDKKHGTARIDIQGNEIYLKESEFSNWVEVKFQMIPYLSSVKAIFRFCLLDGRNKFRLYISPPHIDPAEPAQPISSPSGYSKELVRKIGLFHTKMLPADTKALSNETFSVENYIDQTYNLIEEKKRMFEYEFSRFLSMKRGMFFFYFSNLDQGSHMLWSLRDKQHPFHKPHLAKKYGDQIEILYEEYDRIIGSIRNRLPKDIPLIIASDHGFNPYRRNVNVNTILYENGFIKLNMSSPDLPASIIEYANWSKTKAYAMGMNGLYLNLRGREGNGIVMDYEKRRVLENIKKVLLSYRDPKNGENVISRVFITEDIFSKDNLRFGPDIVIGFNKNYRSHGKSSMGTITKDAVTDRMDWWAGDHCIDPHFVMCTLMTNFKLDKTRTPLITDVAPTILKLYGIKKPEDMSGRSLI